MIVLAGRIIYQEDRNAQTLEAEIARRIARARAAHCDALSGGSWWQRVVRNALRAPGATDEATVWLSGPAVSSTWEPDDPAYVVWLTLCALHSEGIRGDGLAARVRGEVRRQLSGASPEDVEAQTVDVLENILAVLL